MASEPFDPTETPREGGALQAPRPTLWERLRTRRIARKMRKLEQKRQLLQLSELSKFENIIPPAMEQLTTALLAETIGPEGALLRCFQEQISHYSAKDHPISARESIELTKRLVKLAVARRKLLNERLERSIAVGELYRSYYGRVEAIHQLESATYATMEQLERAEEDYLYHEAMLQKVRQASIEEQMQPDDEQMGLIRRLRRRRENRSQDMMEALDEFGGEDG